MNTVKYGYSMGDYLLGMLMSIYTKDYFFWMDNETGIMVKMTDSDNASATLEKLVFGVIKFKGCKMIRDLYL